MRVFKLISAMLLVTLLAACGTKHIYNVNSRKVPVNLGIDKVSKIIAHALYVKGWSIDSQEKGKIVATVSPRKHSASIVIDFTDSTYSIHYLKSMHLKYNPQKKTIHRNYNNWILLLEGEINYFLANPKAVKI